MFNLPFLKNNKPRDESRENSLTIDLRDISKYYKTAAGDYHALKDIELQVSHGVKSVRR